MKTIFKDGTYERVSNEVGDIRVYNQGWKFVSKKEWKTNVRDKVNPTDLEKVTKLATHLENHITESLKKKKYQKPKRS